MDGPISDARDKLSATWTLIVVTHNSREDLRRYWCGRTWPAWLKIVVVDSGSWDDSVAIATSFADVVIETDNRGLSAANNKGLSAATSEFVGFCNPDIRVDNETLLAMEDALRSGGGLVAPRLKGEDGALQPNGRAWPTLKRQLDRRLRPASASALTYLWPEKVDWITGAFVCCTRKDAIRIGGWPDKYFLYFEDVDLCLRARELGYSVRLIESATATHAWRRASSRKIFSFSVRVHAASMVKFYCAYPWLAVGIGARNFADRRISGL